MERARSGKARHRIHQSGDAAHGSAALYDLTELQRHANRLYGFSAQKTLDLAQALYERHKLISYPRTDSRHLSQDVAADSAGDRERDSRDLCADILAQGTGERPLGRDSSTTRRSRITTPSFLPELRLSTRIVAGRAAKSTTWSAGGCSARGMTIIFGR